jgi:hypothetical protein
LSIRGSGVVVFRGRGPARFRLQHTNDRNGGPDELFWTDVTGVSDPGSSLEREISADGFVRRLLVERIDGPARIPYRRHGADWLRAVPFDESEAAACDRYDISWEGRP